MKIIYYYYYYYYYYYHSYFIFIFIIMIMIIVTEPRARAHRRQSTTHPGLVEYVKFADAVEEAFTLKGLEQSPATTPVPVCRPTPPTPPSPHAVQAARHAGLCGVDAAERGGYGGEQGCAAAGACGGRAPDAGPAHLQALRQAPPWHRSAVLLDASGNDAHAVSKTQFRRALSDLGLDRGLPEPAVVALLDKYVAPVGGRVRLCPHLPCISRALQDDIFYANFVDDIERFVALGS